jgi:hypothetical protein
MQKPPPYVLIAQLLVESAFKPLPEFQQEFAQR